MIISSYSVRISQALDSLNAHFLGYIPKFNSKILYIYIH